MSDLRTAAQQVLEACEQRLPLKGQAAIIDELNNLRAALAQQAEPTVTEDMKSAVRWAPSSAYWSERLREFFGPDAREGIDALERRLAKAQQAEPVQDQRCRAEPRSDGDFVCDRKPTTAPPQQAEPVAGVVLNEEGRAALVEHGREEWHCVSRNARRLYAAPPQRKPLTDEEIVDAVREADLDWHSGWTLDEHEPNRFTTLVRAVERAHGIKEN